MKKNRETIKIPTFLKLAEEYRRNITEEENIGKNNITELFYKELDQIINNGELININVNAPPTTGKSITAMAIAQKLMKKHFNKNFGIKDIDRDQEEFSQNVRKQEIKNTIRVIDEWNELETTGENSTVAQAFLNTYSDVCAQQYIHKISCSPTAEGDKNAQIYLRIMNNNKKTGINYAEIYYKLDTMDISYKQILGRIEIDVKPILKTKWYEEYRRRKFEKMKLMLKEGIFRPRELEYAPVTKEISEKLRKLAKEPTLVTRGLIRNYVRAHYRKHRIPLSIIGKEDNIDELMGIIDLWKAFYRVNKRIDQNKESKKLKPEKEETEKELQELRNEIRIAIKLYDDELKRKIQIQKEYGTILET